MVQKRNKWMPILALTLMTFIETTNSFNLFRTQSISASFCIENVGCFDRQGSFPIIDVKGLKFTVNVSICLITQGNHYDNAERLDTVDSFANSSFNATRDTKFIIPGWQSSKNVSWIREMVDELLINDDYNIFVVNWADYLINVVYSIAAADTRFVGDKVGQFIQQLHEKYDYPLEKIHLIGFSLGAHICGFAGASLDGKIGRITGLDPAGPLFDGSNAENRLDSTDGLFVDVIHSNAGPIYRKHLGIDEPIGHVDFYPNGGWKQPNCEMIKDAIWSIITTLAIHKLKDIMDILGCNHQMAVQYFIESINSDCKFNSQPCTNFDAFLNGHCANCENIEHQSKCIPMGFQANWSFMNKSDQSFYLTTSSYKPHCQTMSQLDDVTTTVTNVIHKIGNFLNPVKQLENIGKHPKLGLNNILGIETSFIDG
ncbi:hypothetical protein CHUAL_011805 [Chamberlinius hualienensis]